MNKFVFFIAAAAFMQIGATALAAPAVNTTVEDEYVTVTVSGNIASGRAGEVVNFYIAKAEAEEEGLAHADQKTTSEGGGYQFLARMNPALGGGAFTYTVKAQGAAAETDVVHIVDMGKTLDIVETIKTAESAAAVETAFSGYDPCMDMRVYDVINKTAVYQGLYAGKEEITGAKKFFEALKALTVLAGLNQGSAEMVSDGTLLYMDIIGADENTVYNYNTRLTERGRANVNQYIMKKGYDSTEEYALECKKLVYTNMLTNNIAINYDEAENIIQEFGSIIGIDVSAYNNAARKSDIRMALLNSGAKNPDELKAAYEAAVRKYGNNTDGGGKGTSGGSSSGSVGGYVPSTVKEAEPADDPQSISGFSDMGGYAWAETAVAGLKEKNVMAGKGGNIFAPQDNITREEFVKAIMCAFSLMPENADPARAGKFSDVDTGAWYAAYIAEADKIGVVYGIGTAEYGIGRDITRQDMAAIAFRALRYTKAQIDSTIENEGFSDMDAVDAYAADGVRIFKNMGLLNGYPDGTFRPHSTATRAEAAQLIWNMMNLEGVEG